MDHPIRLFLFTLANVTITGGYLFVAFAIAPKITLRLWYTKVGAVGFFALCGATHLHMALQALFAPHTASGHMATSLLGLIIHVPQAVCVWMFVVGLYVELVHWGPWAVRVPNRPPGGPPATESTTVVVVETSQAAPPEGC